MLFLIVLLWFLVFYETKNIFFSLLEYFSQRIFFGIIFHWWIYKVKYLIGILKHFFIGKKNVFFQDKC